jgi:hypothetical protein
MDGSTMSASHKTVHAAPFLREFANSPWTGGGRGGNGLEKAKAFPTRILLGANHSSRQRNINERGILNRELISRRAIVL